MRSHPASLPRGKISLKFQTEYCEKEVIASHKMAEKMEVQFGFNEDQREQMTELLANESIPLWSQVLYDIIRNDGTILIWHSPRWGTQVVVGQQLRTVPW